MMIIRNAILVSLMSALSFSAFAEKDSVSPEPLRISLAYPPKADDKTSLKEPPPYKLNLLVDAAIVIPATIWSIYAFPKIYSKPNIDSLTVATSSPARPVPR